MPSGVNKRKAARKKKEQEAKINSSRDEGCKSQDGRSSESREVNVTCDHHKCHDQLDGNSDKLEKNDYDASPVLSTVDEDKSLDIERIQGNKETVHELGFDADGVVEVENELTSAKNNAGQGIGSKYIEPGKKFDERDEESSSSSSSSAEEYNIADKKNKAYTSSYKTHVCIDKPDKSSRATIGINESASVGECINSLVETTLVADSVKSEVPVSKEKICLTKVAAGENLVVSDTVPSGLKEDANTLLSNQCDGTRPSSFSNLDSLPKENKDELLALTMENDQSSSIMKQGSKYLEGKTFSSSVFPAVGAGSGKDNAPTFSSSVFPAVGAGSGKDNAPTKDSEIPICSKNQSLASAPMVAQRTSIFSCCGLFDLLKGSN